MKAVVVIHPAVFSRVDGFEQRLHGVGAPVGVVLGRVAKNIGGDGFKL